MVVIAVVLAAACSRRDPLAAQTSPDGRYTLTPSLHEGALVQLTVRERSGGALIDEVKTQDTDAMKWVTGWVDDTSYLFWGADTGTAWVRRVDGATVSEVPIEGASCARLEQLFESKYDERRENCLQLR